MDKQNLFTKKTQRPLLCTHGHACAYLYMYTYVYEFIPCIHIVYFVSVSTFTKIQRHAFSVHYVGKSIHPVYLELTWWSWRSRYPWKPTDTRVAWKSSNTSTAWVANSRVTGCTRATLQTRRSRITSVSNHPKTSISLQGERHRK